MTDAEATYISIFSPERECGESNLMTVLEYHFANPMRSVSVSQSAIFRAIELWKPTFLLDEFDTVVRGDHETREMIRCVLNAGFERGQYAIRNAGQGANMEPKKYYTFGPKVIAGIGELEETIASRCIPIRLKHALPGEYDENWRSLVECGRPTFEIGEATQFDLKWPEKLRGIRIEGLNFTLTTNDGRTLALPLAYPVQGFSLSPEGHASPISLQVQKNVKELVISEGKIRGDRA